MWYIIRHGQTLENSLEIQQGQNQSLLTLKGINQAQSIGYRLTEQKEDFSKYKFVSSPLARTRHTLQIIMEILNVAEKIQPIVEPLLVNRSKGILQGIPKDQIKILFPEEYEKKQKDPNNYIAPGATESRYDLCARIQKFIEKYSNEENLVIVAHGGINSMLRELIKGKSTEEIMKMKEKADRNQNYFYVWDKLEMKRV